MGIKWNLFNHGQPEFGNASLKLPTEEFKIVHQENVLDIYMLFWKHILIGLQKLNKYRQEPKEK